MTKGKVPLEYLIREHTLTRLLGPERQQLSKNILKLPLVEDMHGYYLESIHSLLRNLPSDDKSSVYDKVRELLIGCISPYLLEKNTTIEIIGRIGNLIDIVSKSSWTMRGTARDYLVALRDSYIETSENSSTSGEHRASVVIPTTGECFFFVKRRIASHTAQFTVFTSF